MGHPVSTWPSVVIRSLLAVFNENQNTLHVGSDYVSGARTNYRNSMCPASGYVTARKNCCKPICPAPGKIGGTNRALYIICPASVDVTGIRLPQIYLSGERPKNMSQLKSDVLYCAIIY